MLKVKKNQPAASRGKREYSMARMSKFFAALIRMIKIAQLLFILRRHDERSIVGSDFSLKNEGRRSMRSANSLSVLSIGLGLFLGCGFRIYPPVAHLERVAPIYPDARPQDCNLRVLQTPPEEPFEVFAQVVSYAGSADMAERMETLIKKNACEAGADAIVLLPMQQGTHYNTEDTYPDWVIGKGDGLGGRFPHLVDKRYSVSQRAVALVFKRNQIAGEKRPGS